MGSCRLRCNPSATRSQVLLERPARCGKAARSDPGSKQPVQIIGIEPPVLGQLARALEGKPDVPNVSPSVLAAVISLSQPLIEITEQSGNWGLLILGDVLRAEKNLTHGGLPSRGMRGQPPYVWASVMWTRSPLEPIDAAITRRC